MEFPAHVSASWNPWTRRMLRHFGSAVLRLANPFFCCRWFGTVYSLGDGQFRESILKIAALIAAGGSGTRFGGYPPKQFKDLRGCPVLLRTLKLLSSNRRISECVAVVSSEFRERVQNEYGSQVSVAVNTAEAGSSRTRSILNGLNALEGHGISHVLIHDGARPFASPDLIDRLIDALEHNDGAAPAFAVTDALWSSDGRHPKKSVSKAGLFRVQTPQAFAFSAILQAYRNFEGDAEDDIAVAMAARLQIKLIEGEKGNFKITTREDFERAKMILKPEVEVRTGQGFDIHRFAPGSHVTLCGLKIPFQMGLDGHSDADVAMHAITDALYGSVAEGDIGTWFPPEDARWKNADSGIFLKHALQRVEKKGYMITSIDCTIVCEHPKISPHSEGMRRNLASLLSLDASNISVKATTSERLGFIGREEGIAAIALATIIKK